MKGSGSARSVYSFEANVGPLVLDRFRPSPTQASTQEEPYQAEDRAAERIAWVGIWRRKGSAIAKAAEEAKGRISEKFGGFLSQS